MNCRHYALCKLFPPPFLKMFRQVVRKEETSFEVICVACTQILKKITAAGTVPKRAAPCPIETALSYSSQYKTSAATKP